MFWHSDDSYFIMTQTQMVQTAPCIHETYFGIARSPAHLWTSHPLTIIHCQFVAVLIRGSNAVTGLFSFSSGMQFCIFAGCANVSEHRSPKELKTSEFILHIGICIAVYDCKLFFTLGKLMTWGVFMYFFSRSFCVLSNVFLPSISKE